MSIQIDRGRLIGWMCEQAEIGGTERGGLHRLALTDEDKRARDWLFEKMEEQGLNVRIDRMGNIFGHREGADPDANPVLVGSHLDSQPYGGMYDGALGVLAALEFVATLNDKEIETDRPIEIVNWTNEEGARFDPPMLGSGVWVGQHDLGTAHSRTGPDGKTVKDELERIGYLGEEACEPRGEYKAYLELHIEQGPKLEEASLDIGVVQGVVGLTWTETVFHGAANHTGPTPVHHRNDALIPASDLVTEVRLVAQQLGPEARGTVGRLDYDTEAISIVPDKVRTVWEIVHPKDDIVQEGYERVIAAIDRAAKREGVTHETEEISRFESARFDEPCMQAIEAAADELGYEHTRLFAGAGHDPSNVSAICDTAMVFAVSEDGLSHTEDEFTSWDDCYSASITLANAALRLATEE